MSFEFDMSLEDLVRDLEWWQRWLGEIPKRYKDRPDDIKRQSDHARREIDRIKKLISDRRSGRGDRIRKESEAERRRKARGLPKKKKK